MCSNSPPAHTSSTGCSASHQLPHLRLHERLPCSKSRRMHLGSQSQPPPSPAGHVPGSNHPVCNSYVGKARQRMRSTAPRTRSESHSPNHSQLLVFSLPLVLSSCSVPPPAYQTRGGLCERIRWQRGRHASAAARRGATPARSPNEQEGKENGVRGPLALKLRPMRSMEVKEAARAMSAVTSVLQQRAAASIRREDDISAAGAVGTTRSKAPLLSS